MNNSNDSKKDGGAGPPPLLTEDRHTLETTDKDGNHSLKKVLDRDSAAGSLGEGVRPSHPMTEGRLHD